jgi:hypothetical protein
MGWLRKIATVSIFLAGRIGRPTDTKPYCLPALKFGHQKAVLVTERQDANP